ncbi:DUF692 domain-containing protein [Teredinibacter turnerae]|uniref:MNIO family bufferin maturase n=1 Tax=Teredinibacter turnerae TaxID=2426 RepID=UPI000365A14D|nr:DUF692 domain-containing protein [Teredinibacter turnerae]
MTTNLPRRAGIGLKPVHYHEILEHRPDIGWFEIHPENYLCDGGPPHRYLEAIAAHYPISFHGVGMSLGSAEGVCKTHLKAIRQLCDRYQPAQFSEHLAWSRSDSRFLNDLLPLPYTIETLKVVTTNIQQVQDALQRQIFIENPSSYIDFKHSDYSEPEFLNLLARQTGCGLLLDINNVYVSACNNGFDPYWYIDSVDTTHVGELHLAGHRIESLPNGQKLRLDDHGSEISKPVWQLYKHVHTRLAAHLPVLVEWDNNIPPLATLLAEATKADRLQQGHCNS